MWLLPCRVQVMYRERAAGMYDEMPFAVAQCLIEIPYNLVQSLLFCVISYWMMGFENNAGAAWILFIRSKIYRLHAWLKPPRFAHVLSQHTFASIQAALMLPTGV